MHYRQKRNRGEAFEGYETWFAGLRMSARMYGQVLVVFVVLHGLTAFGVAYFYLGEHALKTTGTWLAAHIAVGISPRARMVVPDGEGRTVATTAAAMVRSKPMGQFARSVLWKCVWVGLICSAIYLFIPLGVRGFKKRAQEQLTVRYIRGARLITVREFNRDPAVSKTCGQETALPFGQVAMPPEAETRHTFIIGRPGTGKTVLLSQVLERLKARGAKGIVYDFKGEYLASFYDPDRDYIFNPLDTRSVGWNLFNELTSYTDVDAMAQSLIPHSIANTDPFWNDAARAVFSGILHYLYQGDLKDNRELWRMLTADGPQIAQALKRTAGGEAGYRFVEDASSKQALSVFAVMMQYCKCFEFMSQCQGSFSIRNWLADDRDGMIFITNYADIQDTLKPILSLFIDLLSRKMLSLSNDIERRIFILLDEIGTLQRLSSILKLLTLSRSKGGAVMVGIQDFGQLDQIYGRNHRQSIVNACGNQVIFAVEDSETAEYCSKHISDTEYEETDKSYSMGPHDMRDGVTLSTRTKKKRLFLPSDIRALPELTGICRFAVHPAYVVSRWRYNPYPEQVAGFLMRKDLSLVQVAQAQQETEEALANMAINFEEI